MLSFINDSVFTTLSPAMALLLCYLCPVVLGLVVTFAFTFRSRNSYSLTYALALLPLAVAVVIRIVNGDVGTGVAVAGAFSLVRFRSAPGSAKDIAAIFISMGVGLACGAGYIGLAILFTVVSCTLVIAYSFLGLGKTKKEVKELRILIPESLDYTDVFEDIFQEFTLSAEMVQVKTSNMGSLYKLTYDVVLKPGVSEKAMLDEIRCRNGNLDVAFGRRPVNADAL